jgi:hypothetical protein
MRNLLLTALALPLFVTIASSQPIPADRMYLGQTPPGNIPKIFSLSVSTGTFATERITISNDNKEIYYSEIKSYYPITAAKTKYYSYAAGKWTGPFLLFEDYCAPAFSVGGDAMYVEDSHFKTFLSVKKGQTWSAPKRYLTKIDSAHYLQATNKGNFYLSSRPKNTVGIGDWCKLSVTGSDTTAVGLGMPLNTAWDNLDFFVARDETFMILTTVAGLSISYPKKEGGWTNPRNMGTKINFGLAMWGPYVTTDNKYLFYTTGTKPDYSDVNVYWVRVDGLIDSLKHTNVPPYMKNKIKSQSGIVGQPFSFTIPDNAFFDEDGETTFTYSFSLNNGNPLPSWLVFDASTNTFYGTPTEAGDLRIIVTATDKGKGSGLGAFKLSVSNKP